MLKISRLILVLFSSNFIIAQSITYSVPVDITQGNVSLDGSLDIGSLSSFSTSIAFNNDGTTLFVTDGSSETVIQYSLTTPFLITSGVSFTSSFSVSGQEDFPDGIAFNLTGTKMFIIGSDEEINQYSLSLPFDLSSGVSFDGSPFSVSSEEGSPQGLAFNNDGSKLYMVGFSRSIFQYNLTTPFDIVSGVTSLDGSFSFNDQSFLPTDLVFDKTGKKMFVASTSSNVFQYSLTTAYDVTSTVSFDDPMLSIITQVESARGIALNELGDKLFAVGLNSSVVQYSLSSTNVFVEPIINDGSLSGELIISIRGDTFFNAGSTLSAFTINNLPSGLTADFFVNSNGSFGTLSLSGNATNHEDINDVNDLNFTFTDAAFTNSLASAVGNAENTNSGLGIDFDPNPVFLTSSTADFTEGISGVVFDIDAVDGLGGNADENITYSITGGDDISLFSINSSSGELSISTALDFDVPGDFDADNAYEIEVSADNGAQSTIQLIQLDLIDVVESIRYSLPIDMTNGQAEFDGSSFSVAAQSIAAQGISFNRTGTKMFVIGASLSFSEDPVFQYSLSTPFDISAGVTFDNVSFDVGAQENIPSGLTFNFSGTKMYIVGNEKQVIQYSLSMPFDLTSGVTFDGSPFSLTGEMSFPTDITFNNTGTKMYVTGLNTNAVHQYNLGASFDVTSGVSYDGRLPVLSQEGSPTDMAFNATGTKLFILGTDDAEINQYTLANPYDVTTGVSFDGSPFSVSDQDTDPEGFAFNSTGSKVFVLGNTGETVSQYTLSTASAYTETVANDGSVVGELFMSLAGDSFTQNAEVTVNNIPSGLAASLAVSSDGSFATLTLDGNALDNANVDDLSDLQFTFSDADFTNSTASSVTNAISFNSGLGIDFDPLPAFLSSGVASATEGSTGIFFNVNAVSGSEGTIDENISYSINGGDDQAFFSIDGSTGELSTIQPLDFEVPSDADMDNVYEVQVNINNGINSLDQVILVTLIDVTESMTYSAPFTVTGQTTVEGSPFSISAQETRATGIVFNPDGTKMFIVGRDRNINQYSLSVPYQITSGVTFDGSPFSVTSQEFFPTDLAFNLSGSKLFIIGDSGDKVNQYSLASPFDITSGITFDGASPSLNDQDARPAGFAFNANGTIMFMLGRSRRQIFQYALTIPFDVTLGILFTGHTLSVNSEDFTPQDIVFDHTGTKLFVIGSSGDEINQYSLANPFDISSGVTFDGGPYSVASQETEPEGLAFDVRGTRMFVVGSDGDEVNQYLIGTTNVFSEVVANDGAIEGEMIISLVGDTFSNSGDLTDFTISNLPAGLTPSFFVSADATFGTLTFSGSAIGSDDINDVTDLQFTFDDAAFHANSASQINNAVTFNSGLGIDFLDNNPPVFLSAGTSVFSENNTTTVIDVDADNGESGGADFAVSYTISAVDDGDLFSIEQTTGIVTFVNPPDFEIPEDANTDNGYVFDVVASDGILMNTLQITVTVNDVNEAPSISDQIFSTNENNVNTTSISTLTAVDPESDAITYTITDGNDLGGFVLSTSGELTVNDATVLDFETNPSFSLSVEASDGTLADNATIIINLSDLEEAPVIEDQTLATNENTANNSLVATLVATDSDNDPVTYTITAGNELGGFLLSIDGDLTVSDVAVLDFETNPVFTLTVQVSDGALTDDATITIDLNDQGEAPSISNQVFATDENTPNTTSIGTLTAVDPEGDAIAYVITDGNDLGGFVLSTSGELIVNDATVLDFEMNPSFSLSVEASDGTLAGSATITINLSNLEEAPIIEDQTFAINENTANTILVGTLTGSDSDNDPLTYTIATGNELGGFSLNPAGDLTINDMTVLDFETNPVFTLTVQASDGALTDEATIIINLSDQEEPPITSDHVFAIDENGANNTLVGTLIATDSDNDVLTYSVVGGNNLEGFALSSVGDLTVNDQAILDFETNPIFNLIILVSDGVLTGSANVAINLNDLAEVPVIDDQTLAIDENTANTSIIGTAVASDSDNDVLIYSIVGGNDLGAFALDELSGVLTVSDETILDFEINPNFSLTVEVSDGALTDNATISISLTDVNEAPQISDQTFSIDENTETNTVVGSVVAIDADNDALTYVITSGNDLQGFTLTEADGTLMVNDQIVLNFETNPVFTLTVEISDGFFTVNATITLNLNDLVEAPIILDQAFQVDENTINGTLIASIVASDPNDDPLTYTIMDGNDLGAFNLNELDGALTVNDATPLDFETKPVFTFTVEVSNEIFTASAIITINLTDIGEAPQATNQSFSLSENSVEGTLVGKIVATDVDEDVLNYTIAMGNELGAFVLDQFSGNLTVSNASILDFETNPSFTLTVEVSDGTLAVNAEVSISLTDLEESPIISDQIFEIEENTASTILVGTLIATDPNNDALTYNIVSGNDFGAFALNAVTGELTVDDASILDFETNPVFTLTIEVSDGIFTDDAVVTINLTDVDELPTGINDEQLSNMVDVFPNPASEYLIISSRYRFSHLDQVYLIDLSGKRMEVVPEVLKDGQVRIGLHSIPTGVYFVKIQRGDDLVLRKIIKK